MGKVSEKSQVVLERTGSELRLTPETWAQILLSLEDNGWVPLENTRMDYYTGSTDVSKIDAESMADHGGRVLQVALNNPLKTYPTKVDMGKFAEFTEFCKEG